MKNNNNIWSSAEELNNEAVFLQSQQQEFFEMPLVEALQQEDALSATTTNRRDFLKFLGFGIGAATVAAGCQIPIKKAIPYVVRPDELVPGIANFYASTVVNGGDAVPVLIKTREGRPIKIEGNPLASLTGGGTSARAQAVVISLYDKHRFKGAAKLGADKADQIKWADLDAKVLAKLSGAAQVRIVSGTIISPSTKRAIE